MREVEASKPAAGRSRFRRPSRRWLLAMGVAAALALGAALAPWTFSTSALLEEISGQLSSSSGLYIAAKGRSTFSLLPRPHITIDSIAFADPAAALTIEAERLHGNVRLPPLLAGRLELADVELIKPSIEIDLDRKPMTSAGAAVRAAAARPSTPEAEKADRARLGGVSIVSGVARLKTAGGEETIQDIDATLDWRTVGSPATLDAAFSWRGERPRAILWVLKPGALLRGEQTPVTARLDSESVRLEAEGFGQLGAKPRYTGRLSASSPSLRHALGLVNVSAPLPGPFENVQLSAKASVGLRDFQLSDLKLSADDNEFEGSFALRREGDKPIVHATLASNFVSLKPIIVDLPPLAGADGQWSRDGFSLPNILDADVDLRLSATRARILRLNLEDAALSLLLRGGRLELALAEAQAYKGTVKGRATFAANAAGALEFHGGAQLSGVDAGALAWDLAARPDLGGALDASLALDATGDSVAQLMRDLDGRASFTLTEGEVGGIDLERALRRVDKRPLSSAMDIRSGHSLVDRASATVKIVKGTANIEDGQAHGPGFSLAFAGQTRIPDRSLALKAQASEADASGKPREKGVQIGFDLSGPWDDPVFAPDAAALIKRSGAAAPLLPRGDAESGAAKER
ncbi:AsmA family protein [Methylosinus sp. Ce-a6]|uniref:AsmA family protein n=1 Tax=Methylosinus sp. Ce-a6 TaxID=2172005 RepID=UPI00135B1826|nr:AsmA family protein [Methylosinus sp. Ce-a6]